MQNKVFADSGSHRRRYCQSPKNFVIIGQKVKLIEKLHKRNRVYSGKSVSFSADKIFLPDGNIALREYLEHPGAVAVIPFLNKEKIINKYKVGVIVKNNDYEYALKEMAELLKDPEIYKRCKETAAKEFNIKDAFVQYEDIYKKNTNFQSI